jgi:hypothetical protein
MQPADWRTISRFGYVFGLIFLLVGLYVYVYYSSNLILSIFSDSNPYRNYALPTIIIGGALLFTGFFVSHRINGKQKLKKTAIISSLGYVFGLIFLLVGGYVYVYYETKWIGWIGLAFYPYQNYAIPMLIAGISLLSIGYFVNRFKNK